MVQFGTVVNGVLVFDGPPPPEGTRLRLEPTDVDDDLWDELDKMPPPLPTETREEFLESLRQSIEDVKAGQGIPADQAFAQIRAELGLPPKPGR